MSGGLVRHHFGSKDGLRTACDAYALDQMMRIKERASSGRATTARMPARRSLSSAHPVMLLLLRYFARSMVDGSPAADAMFEEMVELSEAWLSKHHGDAVHDPRASAALMVAHELGILVFHRQVSHALGSDALGREGHVRLTRAKVDFYAPIRGVGCPMHRGQVLERLRRRERRPQERLAGHVGHAARHDG